MYLHIGNQSLRVTPVVLAGVAAGVGVGFTLLIICFCWCCCRCCCRRKNEKNKKSSRKINVENPPQVKGNQNEGAVEERQHKNNPDTSPTPQLPSPYVSRGTEDSTVPPQPSMPSFASSQTMFTYDELAIATNGFSRGNILGQGGFGFVHKGVLPKGKQIAVKSLKSDSGQGEREFQAEVEIISRVHHRHLVSLVGYCMTGSQRLLVYELVPNYTLEFHLHGKGRPALDWPTRMKIATGAAKGLAYLHEDCHPRIIHRDIKTANILIDNNFEAKVADFGLAKFNSAANADVTTRVMGTLGYLAPEYASSGKITSKSDVYSFGVMLLELITGRRPVNRQQPNMFLVEWARPLLTIAVEDENFSHLVDPRIQESYKHAEMSRMVYCAAICVRQSAQHRPKMSQVVRALEGNQSIKDLSVGITPGRSMVNRYESESEYSDSNYTGTSKGYGSSEIGGTTNEYGFNTSSSSNEVQTTPNLNTEDAKRENSRRPRQRF